MKVANITNLPFSEFISFKAVHIFWKTIHYNTLDERDYSDPYQAMTITRFFFFILLLLFFVLLFGLIKKPNCEELLCFKFYPSYKAKNLFKNLTTHW